MASGRRVCLAKWTPSVRFVMDGSGFFGASPGLNVKNPGKNTVNEPTGAFKSSHDCIHKHTQFGVFALADILLKKR